MSKFQFKRTSVNCRLIMSSRRLTVESHVDFEMLKYPSRPEFIKQLKLAPLRIQKHDLGRFFTTILSHFTNRLHSRVGNEILLMICKLLNTEENINIFAKEKCMNLLPFAQKEFRVQLLDLLFILVVNAPKLFNADIASQIIHLVPNEPRKCLTLIAHFAQSFDNVPEPFPMIDILFRQSDEFRSIECADDFISLLVWMLQKYQKFKKQRVKHCWTYVCDMLKLSNVAILNTCYYALCAIASEDNSAIIECGYPVKTISEHVRRRPLRAATLSLLMRFPPPSETGHMDSILLSLVAVAEDDERATLLLEGLAMDGTNALTLIRNPDWMQKGLPKIIDTMKLFCIILLHQELREEIIQRSETITFFESLLTSNSVGMCSAICTMLRRLPLTPAFVDQLSERGFLGSYFSSILENEEKEVLLSALRLLDTIARVKYVKELSEMVDTIVRLIKEPNELSLAAASVAIDLCKYPKCAKLFSAKRLHEYFRQNMDDSKMRKYADRFLQVLLKVEKSY